MKLQWASIYVWLRSVPGNKTPGGSRDWSSQLLSGHEAKSSQIHYSKEGMMGQAVIYQRSNDHRIHLGFSKSGCQALTKRLWNENHCLVSLYQSIALCYHTLHNE